MFGNVASNLSSSTALARFGSSSFDCSGLGVGILDLRRGLVRLVRHVREVRYSQRESRSWKGGTVQWYEDGLMECQRVAEHHRAHVMGWRDICSERLQRQMRRLVFLVQYTKLAPPDRHPDVHLYKGSPDVHLYKGSPDVRLCKGSPDVHLYEGSPDVHLYKGSLDARFYKGSLDVRF
ncbi:histone acetyltransferase p300-like [Venturia nashicola]|nr:histone acetyltransferase p300-like [Venturia nashicola]